VTRDLANPLRFTVALPEASQAKPWRHLVRIAGANGGPLAGELSWR
jgi:hypothetical protein